MNKVIAVLITVLATSSDLGPVGAWQVRPDSPKTFAASRALGGEPEWSRCPDESGSTNPSEDFCQGIVREQDAEWLVKVLNASGGR